MKIIELINLIEVAEDTFSINIQSEVGQDGGSFIAGALVNKMADGYMSEMVDISFRLRESEQRIYE